MDASQFPNSPNLPREAKEYYFVPCRIKTYKMSLKDQKIKVEI